MSISQSFSNDSQAISLRRIVDNLAEIASGGRPAVVDKLLHVIVTGQSNAVGQDSLPVLTTSAFERTFMFNGGVYPGSDPSNLSSLIPLVEQVTENVFGETVCGSIARYLANNFKDANILVSLTGADGKRYSELAKGTSYYNDSISQVSAAANLATSMGLYYRVLAVCAIHGETDQQFSNTDYASNLIQWQSDYNSDIRSASLQTESVPLLVSQQSGYAPDDPSSVNFTASSALLDLEAQSVDPTKIRVVAPTYFFDYTNYLHFCNQGHRWLGEFFAKSMTGGAGLYPLSAVLSDNQIVIDFTTDYPPIDLDFINTLFQPNYGFTYADDSSSASISGVIITGQKQVTITLSGVPSGSNPEIRYACDTYVDTTPKMGNGKGNLVDSDGAVSNYGYSLANRCVNFRIKL